MCSTNPWTACWRPILLASIAGLLGLLAAPQATWGSEAWLKVSDNRRYLVQQDGSPFFYLGDTAWELFHRLDREQADRYLEDRSRKGFTVIQAVALAELDGLNDPNPYGHRPLIDNDPAKPRVEEGPDNDYWDHVDYIVDKAESLGLVIGMLPTWGDKWNKKWGVGPEVFTPDNAQAYGRWLAERYGGKRIIWLLGGDRPIEDDRHREIIRAMAKGLGEGDGGRNLKTFHPMGGHGSSEWFHEDDWLDFNMRQNGHVVDFRGDQTRADYDREPTKPVIDGEPIYEDHPIAFNPSEHGHSLSADVRRPFYWNLFSGALGHTYGHHSVWQMWEPGRNPINGPLMPWYEAIDQPGAGQMQFGRRLMESRPILTRVPDNSMIVAHRVPTAIPGAGRLRLVGTRDQDRSFAMVYTPAGRPFSVQMDAVGGERVVAWWFNPRNGQATRIGEFPSRGEQRFVPPDAGEYLDWVLVFDDASRGYEAPGGG